MSLTLIAQHSLPRCKVGSATVCKIIAMFFLILVFTGVTGLSLYFTCYVKSYVNEMSYLFKSCKRKLAFKCCNFCFDVYTVKSGLCVLPVLLEVFIECCKLSHRVLKSDHPHTLTCLSTVIALQFF